jgi:hypothetical protein
MASKKNTQTWQTSEGGKVTRTTTPDTSLFKITFKEGSPGSNRLTFRQLPQESSGGRRFDVIKKGK